MSWRIVFTAGADKNLDKLDKNSKKLIQDYLNNKVLKRNHPKELGKALLREFKGLWRYRVDQFRIICEIKEQELVILVVKIGNRMSVYE